MRFEDYLATEFMNENPQTLDDMFPDAFDEWLVELEPETWMRYAEKWVAEEKKRVMAKAT